MGTLLDCLDAYQDWRDNLPAGVADSAIAERLDSVLELRDLVEQLEAIELPRGFRPRLTTKTYRQTPAIKGRRLTRKLAVPSVIEVPTRWPARYRLA